MKYENAELLYFEKIGLTLFSHGLQVYHISFCGKVRNRRGCSLLDVEIALYPWSGIFTHRGMMDERRQKRRPSRAIGADCIFYPCPYSTGKCGDRLQGSNEVRWSEIGTSPTCIRGCFGIGANDGYLLAVGKWDGQDTFVIFEEDDGRISCFAQQCPDIGCIDGFFVFFKVDTGLLSFLNIAQNLYHR